MALVYLATSPSGKHYVGWTSRALDERKYEHEKLAKAGSKLALSAALRKHGTSSFTWRVLCETDDASAPGLEIGFIRLLGTKGRGGYNLTDGGEGASGVEWTAEARARNAATQSNLWKDPTYRLSQTVALTEAKARPELRALLSAKQAALWQDPEYRANQSEARSAVWRDPEFHAKMTALSTAQWASEEAREAHAVLQKQVWSDPQLRREMSERKRQISPERLQAIRALIAEGLSFCEIGRRCGVSSTTVKNIKIRKYLAYQ